MTCPHCKNELPDDSRFCQYCGRTVGIPMQPTEESLKKEKKRTSWAFAFWAVFGIIILFTGIYFGTYCVAKRAAVNRDFAKATDLLIIPSLTQFHDPGLVNYIHAGQLYSQGNYLDATAALRPLADSDYLDAKALLNEAAYYEALDQLKSGSLRGYSTIVLLAENGNPFAIDGLEAAKKYAYDHAVSLYRNRYTMEAMSFFMKLVDYQRSNDYITLINRTNYYSVKRLIGFENANDILISFFADEFLFGTWKTFDGKLFFSLDRDNNGDYHSKYNLPAASLSHAYFDIVDGILYLSNKPATLLNHYNGNIERKNVFLFTIINADTIRVYCFKDGSTYKLFRQ